MTQSLLPLIRKITPQLIGQKLVSVQPLSSPIDESKYEEVKNEVNRVNRDSKIDSITVGSEYKEYKMEDHPEYKNINKGIGLFYLDYLYSTPSVPMPNSLDGPLQ